MGCIDRNNKFCCAPCMRLYPVVGPAGPAGNNDQILDNEIYGPEQAGDSSNWVVNRGFVTQGSATNLLVRNNIFYSLRQPAYLNPNSTKCGRYCFIIWN